MATINIYSSRNDWSLEGATVVSWGPNENGNLTIVLDFVGRDGKNHSWHFTPAYNQDVLEAALDKAVAVAEEYEAGSVRITCGYAGGKMLPVDLWVDDGLD